MERWEYNHFISEASQAIAKLNILGKHGWQCYSVTVESTTENISQNGHVV